VSDMAETQVAQNTETQAEDAGAGATRAEEAQVGATPAEEALEGRKQRKTRVGVVVSDVSSATKTGRSSRLVDVESIATPSAIRVPE